MYRKTNAKFVVKIISLFILSLLYSCSFFFDTAGPPRVYAADNVFTDKVGIGMTSPSSKLQVSGGGSYFGTGLAAPTIGTVSCSTSGGTLAAGTYYYKVSYLDANGLESIASSEAYGTVASGTTGSCTVNWTDVSGCTSYRIYGRVSAAQNQYWTDTATPYVDTGSAPVGWSPPSSTGASMGVYSEAIFGHSLNYRGNIQIASDGTLFSWGPADGSGTYGWIAGNTISGAYNNPLILGASDAEVMRIAETGNVGIGTTNPQASLDVAGTGIRLGGVTRTSWPGSGQWSDVSGGIYYNSGNVGIGTTNPTNKLDVEVGDSDNAGVFVNGYDSSYGAIKNSTGAGVNFALANSTGTVTHLFRPYGNSYINTGNVGIGTTAPLGLLQVGTSPSPGLLVTNQGNVGIGTTNPGAKLVILDSAGATALQLGDPTHKGENIIAYYDATGTQSFILNPDAAVGSENLIDLPYASGGAGHFIRAGGLRASASQLTMAIGSAQFEVRDSWNGDILFKVDNTGGSPPNIDVVLGSTNSTTQRVYPGKDLQVDLGISSNRWRDFYVGRNAFIAGNVGIGTTAPLGLLQVGTSPSPGLIVLPNGNVGIGTTNPLTTLDVRGTIENGLTAWWSMDEGTGATTDDQSINSNTATLGGGTPDYKPTWVTGKFGKALHFDGIDDFVDVTDNGGFDNQAQITAEAWFKLDQLSSTKGEAQTILRKIHAGDPWLSWLMQANTDGGLAFIIKNASGTDVAAYGSVNVANRWWHAVGTYDGVNVKLYINGVLSQSNPQTGNIYNSDSSLRIGAEWSGGNRLNGTIDEVRIYNRALSDREVAEHYRQGAPTIAQGGMISGDLIIDSGNVGIGTVSPLGLLQVGTSPTPGLLVTADGRVGIGTTSPSGTYKLYVNGDTYLGGVTVTNGTLSFGGNLDMKGYQIRNTSNIGIGVTNPGTAALAVMNGNVGIGNTAPAVGLHIGTAASNHSLTSSNDVIVSGQLEVDGLAYFDSTLFIQSFARVYDDKLIGFGNGVTPNWYDAALLYETADPNARALIGFMDKTMDAPNNVPVFVWGDETILNKDLGFFNGVAQPRIAVVNDPATNYVSIGFSADDTAMITSNLDVISIDKNLNIAAGKSLQFMQEYMIYEQASDPNAYVFSFNAPEGGATFVPVFVFSDASYQWNTDLGFFNGVTQPRVVALDSDIDSHIDMGFNADDIGMLQVAGAGTTLAINPSGGNVGIGTTSPGAKLDVLGGASTISLVKNGGFNLGVTDSWNLWVNTGVGASATSSVDASAYMFAPQSGKISVTNGGTDPVWFSDIQFRNFITGALLQNRYYTLSFWMKASTPVTRNAAIIQADDPWTTYASKLVSLTTSWQKFTLGFQYTGTSSTLLQIDFLLGGTNSVDYWIDGVTLVPGSVAPEFTALTVRDNGELIAYGNVGIGTTNPGQKLQVNGNTLINNNLALGGSAIDPYRFLNIDVQTSQASASQYGIYSKVDQTVANPTFETIGAYTESRFSGSGTNKRTIAAMDLAYASGTGVSERVVGVVTRVENLSTGTGHQPIFIGLHGQVVDLSASSTIDHAWAADLAIWNDNTGTITQARGLGIEVGNNIAGGTIGTVYGISIGGYYDTWVNNGTINTSYGLYLDPSIDVGATKYAIYSASTSNSYFAGNVGIGTTNPIYKLQVNGTFDATTITQNGSPIGGGGWTSASGKVYTTTSTDNVGIGTTAPTHALTFPVSSTGIALYNTADQTTNYERLVTSFASNVATISNVAVGSGTSRVFRLEATNPNGYARINMQRGSLPFVQITNDGIGSLTGTVYQVTVDGTLAQTSGPNYFFAITPTYNQTSSTAANTDLLINRTQTAVGSGAQYLIDAQVATASKFRVSNTGDGYFAGNLNVALDIMTWSYNIGKVWGDADATMLRFRAPEGDATDVPVFAFSDASVNYDTNLGWFNGITEPRIAVIDDDADSWVSLGFSADDTPMITSNQDIINIDKNFNIDGGKGLWFSQEYMIVQNAGDTDAHVMNFRSPEGGANNVPVFVFSDSSYNWNTNLGLFNGITESRIAVLDNDINTHIDLGFNADNKGLIQVAGAGTTLLINPSGGLVSIGPETGNGVALNVASSSFSSGKVAHIYGNQTSVNAGDTNDGGLSISYNLTASSASNELVARPLWLVGTNTLTGGGHIQNLRMIDIVTNTETGTVTDSLSSIYLEANNQNGTVTNGYGLYIATVQGTNAWGIYDNSGRSWYSSGNVGIGWTSPTGILQVGTSPGQGLLFVSRTDGNVGIGTTNPVHKLHVAGNLGLSASSYINFGTTDGDSGYGFKDNSGTIQYKNSGGGWANLGTGGSQTPWTANVNAAGYTLTNTTNIGIGVSSPGTAALAVMNGNVGIGTTNPEAKLQISGGNIALDNTYGIWIKGNGGSLRNAISVDSSNNLNIGDAAINSNMFFSATGSVGIGTTSPSGLLQVGTSPSPGLFVGFAGSVGIGTTSPQAKLEVNGTLALQNGIANALQIRGTGGGYNPTLWVDAGNITFLKNTNPELRLGENNADVMTLILGNVGIGWTSPTGILQVGTSPGQGLLFVSRTAGNVGIGTTNPTSKLSVIGTMTVGNSGDNYDVIYNSDLAGNNLQWDANYGASLDGSLIFNYASSPTRAWNVVMPGIKFIPPTDPAGALTCGLFLNMENNDAYGNRLDMGWGGDGGGNFELYSKNHDARPGQFRIIYGGTATTGHIEFKHYEGGSTWYVNSGVNEYGRFMVGLRDYYFPGKEASTVAALLYPFQVFNEGKIEVFHVTTAGNIQGDGVLNIDGTGNSYLMGNVGIGTSAPLAKLYLVGSGTSAGFALRIADSTPTDRLVVLDNGNVGIGTTNPIYKLQVNGTFDATTITQNGSPIGGGGWTSASGKVYTTTSTDNVGIGTTTPSQKLHVVGEAVVEGGNFTTGTGEPTYKGYLRILGHSAQTLSQDLGLEFFSATGASGYGWRISNPDLGNENIPLVFQIRKGSVSWSEVMRIDKSGNVGIGTTNPSYKLQLSGGSGLAINTTADYTDLWWGDNNYQQPITFDTGSADYKMLIRYDGETDVHYYSGAWSVAQRWGRGSSDGFQKMAELHGEDTDQGLDIYDGTTATVKASISGTGKSYFNAGNVGIGTTNPTEKLEVNGKIYAVDTIYTDGNLEGPNGYFNIKGAWSSGGINFQAGNSGGAWLNRMFISTNGNVGIGTTNPAVQLDVYKDSADAISRVKVVNSGNAIMRADGFNASTLQFYRNSAANWEISRKAFTDDLYFNDYGAGGYGEGAVVFKTAGNVGIGTTNPQGKLQVVSTSASAPSSFSSNVGIGTTNPGALLSVGSNTFQVNSSGNLVKVNNVAYSWPSSQGGASTVLTNDSSGNLSWAAGGGGGGWTSASGKIYPTIITDKVGIGTTGPGSLHLYQAAPNTLAVQSGTALTSDASTGNNYITFRNGADNATYQGLVFQDNNVGGYLVFRNVSGTGHSDSMMLGTYNNFYFQTGTSGVIDGKTDVMTILQNGRVGIGTTNPGEKLQVNGNALINNYLALGGTAISSDRFLNVDLQTSQPSAWQFGLFSRINQTVADVGVGVMAIYGKTIFSGSGTNEQIEGAELIASVTGPGASLYVVGSSNYAFNASSGTDHQPIFEGLQGQVRNSSATSPIDDAWGADLMVWNQNTGTIARARGLGVQISNDIAGGTIDTAYGISIGGYLDEWVNNGTINTSYGLYLDPSIDVGATKYAIYSASTANSYFAGNVGIGTTGPLGRLQVGTTPGAPLLIVKDSGNVGIGTSNPLYNLKVVGTFDATTITQNGSAIGGSQTPWTANVNAAGYTLTNTTNIGIGVSSPGTAALAVMTGNVGIGTTNPTAHLYINQTSAQSGQNAFYVSAYNAGSPNIWKIDTSGDLIGPVQWMGWDSNVNSGAYSSINTTLYLTSGYSGGTSYNIILKPSGSGNVGIGNTAPQALLDVGTTPGKGLIITSAGNVGIGTTAPGAKLGLKNDGTTDLDILLDNGTAQGIFEVQTNNVVRMGTVTNHSFEFITNNDSRFKVENDGDIRFTDGEVTMTGGNVGIGTTNPTTLLDIEKDNITTNVTPALTLKNLTAATAGAMQNSPTLYLRGSEWDGDSSEEIGAKMYVKGNTAGSNSTFSILVKRANSADYNTVFAVNSFGYWETPVMRDDWDNRETINRGMQVSNYTDATVSYDQYSSAFYWVGKGWKTGGTAASQTMSLGQVVAPEQGTTNPIGVWKAFYGTNTDTPTEANELFRLEWGDRLGAVFNKNNTANYTMSVLGNVGIGWTSPAGILHIGTSPGQGLLFVTKAGNVGIGTTNPTAKLDIAGTGFSTISNSSGNITITPATNFIISSGNVGIGTTNPGAKLAIGGGGQLKINDYILPAGTGAPGQHLETNGAGTVNWQPEVHAFGITIDGGGSAITTGSKGYISIPYNCTIKSWHIFADTSGSCVVDVKKSTYSGFPTTASIAASAKPTLSAVQKNQDTTLTGWTTAVTVGDVIEFNVDSATTVTRVNLVIKVEKAS